MYIHSYINHTYQLKSKNTMQIVLGNPNRFFSSTIVIQYIHYGALWYTHRIDRYFLYSLGIYSTKTHTLVYKLIYLFDKIHISARK